jgi:xanthine dehydrogenase accessory factor
MTLCLIRGTGDVGSAVAHALFRAGYPVLLHDQAAPAHSRRGMAFVDALFDGLCRLEGLLSKRARDIDDLPSMINCGIAVPVSQDDFACVLDAVKPAVLVDARMRKRSLPETQRGLAPLTLGLGPNFIAGATTDIAIETGWGEDLGRVIRAGSTRALEGEPQPIEGIGRDRYVYAPVAGTLRTQHRIGDRVEAGDTELAAPIAGCIRGLTHDGVTVAVHTKVIEIDPRNDPALVFGLGKRPAAIASGVLAALREHLPPSVR